jgi:nicotinamide-nucleotide amidase
VGDTIDEIKSALDYLIPQSDAIIVGGGLGPTHDDLTMEALSNYFSIALEYDAEWVTRLEAYFQARQRTMNENNRKQGYLLKGAQRIDNDCGTAAGQHLTQNSLELFVVPGVPHEMKSMMEHYILPTLQKKTKNDHEKILKKTLLTTGIGESALAERCDSFVQKVKTIPNLSLAFLPASTGVRLRLQMAAKNAKDEALFSTLVTELRDQCEKDFFGFDPTTLEEVIIDFLREQKSTLSVAESCTGGFASHRLTQVSGSSEVLRGSLVVYQTTLKELELGITHASIEKHGVVSEQVAKAMAEGIRKKWGTTYAISTTGYLGPTGGDVFASVGTVWIAVSSEHKTVAREFKFEANRERGKERATQAALDLFRRTFLS